MSITIRPATSDDVPQMRFPLVAEETLAGFFTTHSAFVAVDCLGRVLGQVLYAIIGEDEQRSIYFFLPHVDEALRGQGIGSRLIAAVEDIGREAGCAGVTLGVDVNNPQARALYERRGYAVFDTRSMLTSAVDPPLQVTEDLMVKYLAQKAAA